MAYGSTTPVISAAHHTSVDKCASIVPTPKDTNIVNTMAATGGIKVRK